MWTAVNRPLASVPTDLLNYLPPLTSSPFVPCSSSFGLCHFEARCALFHSSRGPDIPFAHTQGNTLLLRQGTMFHAFLPIFFSLLSLATTSASPSEPLPVRSRSLPRRLEHDLSLPAERDFAKRGPPSGWSTYVASGNDGGGCYRDWTPRILPDYNTRIDSSSVEAGLKACQAKGYKFAGLQNSNEVYVGYFSVR